VVSLLVGRETLIDRLTSRRVCTKCGETFNVKTLPPPPEGECGDPAVSCQGEDIVQREDDTPETGARRLDVYEESPAPLVAYYREKELLVGVDGAGGLEDVFDRVTAAVP
jgi:adenylate kinase